MIGIKIIDKANERDINIKNEPFKLWGRVCPSYTDGVWGYSLTRFKDEEITEMCFPDENYNYDEMSKDCVFIGAYDGERCIGLAILQNGFFKYMYLYDLKVDAAYRGQHVGHMLIDKAKEIAEDRGYIGIYTIGQDNNAGACLFYLGYGFRIGGLDTEVYTGTSQEGKADILFYLNNNAE